MLQEKKSPSIVQALGISIALILVMVFGIIAMNTGDLFWFWPLFNETPHRIVIHCYGDDNVITPDDPAFDAINDAVNKSLSGSKRWDPLSMSDMTYEDYQTSTKMMAIELAYDPPVRMHTFYKFFKNLDILVIPLDGRHASSNSVFGRLRGRMLAGSMHVETRTNIITALDEQGLCHQP